MPRFPLRVRKPSAAMVVAVVALVTGSSGTALAAHQLMSGDKLIRPGSLSGNRLRKHTLSGAQINLRRLGEVPTARRADTATTAGTATNAGTASNAIALGGIPPSGYARTDCSSLTGQVKGFAMVPSAQTFPSSWTNLTSAYNCSGQQVQARRIMAGTYEVRFLGSPVTIAVGSVLTSANGVTGDEVTFAMLGPGDFRASLNASGLPNVPVDQRFAVITP